MKLLLLLLSSIADSETLPIGFLFSIFIIIDFMMTKMDEISLP